MIRNVGDFLNVVNQISPKSGRAIFRGQLSDEQDVNSSLLRFANTINQTKEKNKKNPRNISKSLLNIFNDKFPAYPESFILKNYSFNLVDVLMTAQHYGMPTRLIDWTYNPLIALYFAVENEGQEGHEEDKGKYVSVFMLKNTGKNDFNIVNSEYIINEILCDKAVVYGIFHCINKGINLCSEFNYKNRGCNNEEISTSVLEEISLVENKELMKIDSSFFIDLHGGGDKNFFNLGERIAEDIQNTIHEPLRSLKQKLEEIKESLLRKVENHEYGLAGIELYGDSYTILDPLPINNRIKNQQGVFLFSKSCSFPEFEKDKFVHGVNLIRYKKDAEDKMKYESVVRIDIKKDFAKEIKKELSHYGINKSFVYPELSSFCEQFKDDILSELEED